MDIFTLNGKELRKIIQSKSTVSTGKRIRHDATFSLIILNKNAPDSILPLLEILKSQDTHYHHVIVGTIGSEDNTLSRYYKKRGKNIRVIKNSGHHKGAQYNYLVKKFAQGEIIGLIHNHITLADFSVFKHIETIFDNKDVGATGVTLVDNYGPAVSEAFMFFRRKD